MGTPSTGKDVPLVNLRIGNGDPCGGGANRSLVYDEVGLDDSADVGA
jgi:hypothetical protein